MKFRVKTGNGEVEFRIESEHPVRVTVDKATGRLSCNDHTIEVVLGHGAERQLESTLATSTSPRPVLEFSSSVDPHGFHTLHMREAK